MFKIPDPPTNDPWKRLQDYLLEVHLWIGECQKVMQSAIDSITNQGGKNEIDNCNDNGDVA